MKDIESQQKCVKELLALPETAMHCLAVVPLNVESKVITELIRVTYGVLLCYILNKLHFS